MHLSAGGCMRPTLNGGCLTNNVRELTNTKSSDYNVIVQSPSGITFQNWLKGEREKKIE